MLIFSKKKCAAGLKEEKRLLQINLNAKSESTTPQTIPMAPPLKMTPRLSPKPYR